MHPIYISAVQKFKEIKEREREREREREIKEQTLTSNIHCQYCKSIVYMTCTVDFQYWQ